MGCVDLSRCHFHRCWGTVGTQCQLCWRFSLSSAILLPLLEALGDFLVVSCTLAFDWQHSTCGAAADSASKTAEHTQSSNGAGNIKLDGDKWKPRRANKTLDRVKLLPARQCSQNNHLLLAVLKWFNEVEGVIPKGHECWMHWVEKNAPCWMRSMWPGPLLAWQRSPLGPWWGCPDVPELGFNSHGPGTSPAEDSADGDLWH